MKIARLSGAWGLGRIVVCVIIFLPIAARAGASLSSLFYGTDITVALGSLTAFPYAVIRDDLSGGLSRIEFPAVQATSVIRGYVRMVDGRQLIVFAPALILPTKSGTIIATPRDVVSFDGTNYSIYFNGEDPAKAIPVGASISALTMEGSNLVIALDTTVKLPGTDATTITASPRDLIAMTANGPPYSIFFDGGAAGVSAGTVISGAAWLPDSGNFLFVFDSTGSIAGVNFSPHTILEFAPPSDWSAVTYDGEADLGSAKLRAIFAIASTPSPTLTATATSTVTATPTPTPTATPTVVPVLLGFSPKTIRFPTQKLGKTGTTSGVRHVTISNPRKKQSIAVQLLSPRLSNSEFAVVSNACTSPLEPGKKCQMGLTFTPRALGRHEGTLEIIDNAENSPQTVTMTGNSVAAPIVIKPERISFGKVKVGAASAATRIVVLRNANQVALEIKAIALQPIRAGESEFKIPAGQCLGELGPGGQCPLTVSFLPATKGARSAKILITDDAKGSPQSVKLTGSGK
jgi:hypothetical protein